jgi:hypothetical protein
VRFLLAFALAWPLAGCPAPDLGNAPFLCNPGLPQCPSGYVCVTQEKVDRCVKDGVQLQYFDQRVDGPADAVAKGDWPQLPDRPKQADKPPVRWDGQPPKPDLPATGDGLPPHLGCQSQAECANADPSTPCCCPLVLNIWSCLPFCLNPLCA